MGKKSRSSSAGVARRRTPRRGSRRRHARALPLRLRSPLQGVPRPGQRRRVGALGDAPLRGTARRGRLGRAARDRPGRHGHRPDHRPSTAPATSPSRPCCRWPGPRCTAPTEPSSSACRPRAVRATRAGTPRPRCSPRSRPTPGTPVGAGRTCPGPGPRLQDVLEPGLPFDVDVHPGFDFWLAGVEERDARGTRVDGARQRRRRPHPPADVGRRAYWCEVGSRRHLRWVLPQPEDRLLDALARLHAAERSVLVEGSRYVGAFRADGLLVPVWDLPAGHGRRRARAAGRRVRRATRARLSPSTAPLTADERRARAGVVSRQLTLR